MFKLDVPLFAMSTTNDYYILGLLLNWGLYGALSAQVYLYYLAFPVDRTINRALVYGIYFLETVQSMCMVVIGFDLYSSIHLSAYLSWTAVPLLGGFVTLVVQSFYAYRILILTRSWVIVILIVVLAHTQFVLSMVGGAMLFWRPMIQGGIIAVDAAESSSKFSPLPLVWTALNIGCDIIIATTMTYFLLHNDDGLKSTHVLLVKLVRLAIETGTATVIVSIICLISLCMTSLNGNASDDVNWEGAAFVPILLLGKVYSNAMMANFNHRVRIENGRNDAQITSFVVTVSLFPQEL